MAGKGTPGHTIRIPDKIWNAAHAVAEDRDETIGDVVRRLLAEYAGLTESAGAQR